MLTAGMAAQPTMLACLAAVVLLQTLGACAQSSTEVASLLDFKNGLTSSSALDSWQDAPSPCSFFGVTCNADGSVSEL